MIRDQAPAPRPGQAVAAGAAVDRLAIAWRAEVGVVVRVSEPGGVVSWPEIAARLAVARSYWLGTTMPDGAPHAAPVWGVVIGQVLFLYSERRTRKARNLASDPRLVLHTESGDDVLIVHGTADDLGHPAQVPGVVTALAAKYASAADRQYLPDADPSFDVVYAVRPKSAIMWQLPGFEESQRRWTHTDPR